jgi:hypothetical protein
LDNDYRLAAGSPCIDKGKTEEWMWQAVEVAGNPRILPGPVVWRVDMGAYEYMPPTLRPIVITLDDAGQVRVIRISQSGETYVLQSCLDLLPGDWKEEAIVPSDGSLRSWIEPDTAPGWKFYRIEIR